MKKEIIKKNKNRILTLTAGDINFDEPTKCPKCGKNNPAGWLQFYCMFCKKDLTEEWK